LKQFFQPLSVSMMFGMQAIDFFAQRGILYFIHQAPPLLQNNYIYRRRRAICKMDTAGK
jgi:hypothetical protein